MESGRCCQTATVAVRYSDSDPRNNVMLSAVFKGKDKPYAVGHYLFDVVTIHHQAIYIQHFTHATFKERLIVYFYLDPW
jgi:hypothetical protein